MGVYLLCARSGKGKSTLFMNICSEIQKQIHKRPLLIWWVGDHPEEMDAMKKNKNTRCTYFAKDKLREVVDMIFDPVLKDILKLVYIDDCTTMDQSEKNGPIMRAVSQCRHVLCSLFFGNHYINSLNIAIKALITDYAIWAPVAANKLKDFYDFNCADSFDCQAGGGHDMDYKKFIERFQREVAHSDMPRDDPHQKDHYHNFCWLSFPTLWDARAVMKFDSTFDLKNEICLWEVKKHGDHGLDEEDQEELAGAAAAEDSV